MLEINSKNFDEIINSGVPVLVDFWATWCAPCRAIAPTLEKLSSEYEGKIQIVKIDIDDNQDIATRFNVMSIPTLTCFKGGKVVSTIIGAVPEKKIRELLDGALA